MKQDQPPSIYKDSINLPVTEFPMKANLPVREKEILARWESTGLYGLIRLKSEGRKRFVLHDGPPFANGDIHLGHALNKVLKDIAIKYRTMKGFDSPYVPGWDCHGLPIEHKVMKEDKQEGGKLDPLTIRAKSAAYARKYIDVQREQFKRLGVLGDWERPYVTMDPAYEADVLRTFASLVSKGLVYESLRPVYWSTGCQTALAEAEVEYQDRSDTSVYIRFPLVGKENQFLVVWTTTPWTLPANLAIAAHPQMEYVVASDGSDTYHVVSTRFDELQRLLKRPLREISRILGKQMEGVLYKHPFLSDGRERRVVLADFVTAETGTGLVHIAPGHGYDDYVLGQKCGLELLSPVDDRGCLTGECGVPQLAGQYVFKANPLIVEMLRASGMLIADENYGHSYPYCWRSKTPIIFRSVKQWFIRVDAFRADALGGIDEVRWIPDWGKNRIRGSVESRHDWCISRQRTWGIPIPVFYDVGGNAVLREDVIRRFAARVEKDGADIWFKTPDEALAVELGLPPGLRKGNDTLDVWIDSGSSFKAVAQKQLDYPADLYLEGSDQHRGWFQSSLLIACAIGEGVPYKSVLTHGFVVDGEGKKMSKSVGNVVSPQEVIQSLGADVLRLWVASSLYTDDIRVSKDIFDRLSDSYRKFRNTFKYLLGNIRSFDPVKDRVPHTQMLEIDRWAMSRLAALVVDADAAFDTYQYHRFYQSIYNFCAREMSAFYFDILKDRLYADARTSPSGRSARTALFDIFGVISRLLAPVLSYTTDEAWSYLPAYPGKAESVHLEDWPSVPVEWRDTKLEARWERIAAVRESVLKALEETREKKEIGNSLEAEVELAVSTNEELEFFCRETALLASVFLVSSVSIAHGAGESGIRVRVTRAVGVKCARCWNWRKEVGSDAEFPDLCTRCVGVMRIK